MSSYAQTVKNYTINTTNKTITFSDYTTLALERIALITDITTGSIIYQFNSTAVTGSVSTNVLTLSSMTGVSNTDKLRIDYTNQSGDPTYEVPALPAGASTSSLQSTGNTSLATIANNTGTTPSGSSTSALQTAGNASLSSIATNTNRINTYLELTGLSAAAANADLIPSTDASSYRSFSLQILGTWSGTLTVQVSNDNVNWSNGIWWNSNDTASTATSTATGNSVKVGPVDARWIRVRMTSFTTGTATGTAEFFTVPFSQNISAVTSTQNGTWTVGSNSATGSAVPSNAHYMGMNSSGSNLTGLISMSGIGVDAAGGSNILAQGTYIFNGTNFDRTRSVSSASNTTGTGLMGVGNLGYDGANYQLMGVAPANAATTGNSGISQLTSGTGFTTATITLNSTTPNSSWYDLLNYPWVSVGILTNPSAVSITFQTASDSAMTNIRTTTLQDSQSTSGTPTTASGSAVGTFSGPRTGRYFRISSPGTNTVTLAITFYTVAPVLNNAIYSGNATNTTVPGNAFYIGMRNNGGNLQAIFSAAAAGGDGSSLDTSIAVANYSYNGSTFDRLRANTTGAVVAAGATTSQTVNLTTYNAKKLHSVLSITAGTGSATMAINGVTSSGYTYPLVSTSSAASGVGTTSVQRIGPGLSGSTGLTANDMLPRTVQIVITVTGTLTYGVDYQLGV